MTALWSDDGINLGFPGPPVVEIKAIGEAYAKFREQYPEFKVLKYARGYKNTQIAIVDEWAIEAGSADATFKMSASAAQSMLRGPKECICSSGKATAPRNSR